MAKAEEDLQDLIKRGLEAKAYAEIAAVAALAESMSSILSGTASMRVGTNGHPAERSTARGDRKVAARRQATHAAPPRLRVKLDYPQFEREGDRLIKIGWSKKDRRTYEHRAPRPIVMSVVSRLASGVIPGRVFTMDKLQPFQDDHGQEVPAYQAYLVLKWLQKIGAVTKRGKDGYIAQGGALTHDHIARAWDALRER